jgi:uncharacterized protein (DUF433 family)
MSHDGATRTRTRIVREPTILGGCPTVEGTRVPALTIIAELRGGATPEDFREHYPTLPEDGVEAVVMWARENGISIDLGLPGFESCEWPPETTTAF